MSVEKENSSQSEERRSKSLKITVVGDPMVGKTCLLVSYKDQEFPEEHVPTVFENHPTKVSVDGTTYDVTIWDSAGQEEYKGIRVLSYPGTDVFILCFSAVDRESFENIQSLWSKELKANCRLAKILLVATKIDLKDVTVPAKECVSLAQGKRMAKKTGCNKYMECSAKTRENVNEVFAEAVRLVTSPEPSSCQIL